MKPAPFKYYAPTTVDEALAHLAEHGWDAKVLAGGQSLIPMMNFRLAQPAVLVDLNPVAELSYISPTRDGGLRIGAMTRQRQVERDPLVAERAPLVHEAMPKIAYPPIRSRGTIGGTHRPRRPLGRAGGGQRGAGRPLSAQEPAAGRALGAAPRTFSSGLFTTVLEPDELLVEVALPPMPRAQRLVLPGGRPPPPRLCPGGRRCCGDAGRRRTGATQARLVYFSVGDGPVEAHQAAAAARRAGTRRQRPSARQPRPPARPTWTPAATSTPRPTIGGTWSRCLGGGR